MRVVDRSSAVVKELELDRHRAALPEDADASRVNGAQDTGVEARAPSARE
jgi:hypothetical protein